MGKDLNTGNRNTGNRNTGNRNTGNRNTGDINTGDINTGNRNTGNWNTGNRNTGNWNTGNMNTGFFCVNTPSPMFFDQPTNLTWDEAYAAVPYVSLSVGAEFIDQSNMTDPQKEEHPNYKTIGGFLRAIPMTIQQSFPLAWAKMSEEEKAKWLALPNFDADKFLACTGVDVRLDPDLTEYTKVCHIVKIKLVNGSIIMGELVQE